MEHICGQVANNIPDNGKTVRWKAKVDYFGLTELNMSDNLNETGFTATDNIDGSMAKYITGVGSKENNTVKEI
jgi:hypothetical protein